MELICLEPEARRLQTATGQLLASNKTAAHFGLSLSEGEAKALALRHLQILAETGRVEFGEGIAGRLAFAFCDSPYVAPATWAQALAGLLECFFYYKNESSLPDDELLDYMKTQFDGACAGSMQCLYDKLDGACRGEEAGGET